jgi:hypothetical protein
MKTLTGMGGLGNAQELAELLRQMGRGPDSMLAHITPEEAQMLLESGGSGRMNPMTGLPEFQPDYNYDVEAQEGGFYGEIPNYDVEAQPGGFYGEMQQAAVPLQREFVSQPEIPMVTAPAVDRYGMQPQFESPAETMRLQEYAQGLRTPQEVQPSILDRLKGGLQSAETGYQDFTQNYPMLSRLLTTGAASLPSLLAARSARREGGRRLMSCVPLVRHCVKKQRTYDDKLLPAVLRLNKHGKKRHAGLLCVKQPQPVVQPVALSRP